MAKSKLANKKVQEEKALGGGLTMIIFTDGTFIVVSNMSDVLESEELGLSATASEEDEDEEEEETEDEDEDDDEENEESSDDDEDEDEDDDKSSDKDEEDKDVKEGWKGPTTKVGTLKFGKKMNKQGPSKAGRPKKVGVKK